MIEPLSFGATAAASLRASVAPIGAVGTDYGSAPPHVAYLFDNDGTVPGTASTSPPAAVATSATPRR